MNNCNKMIPAYKRMSGLRIPMRTMFSRRGLTPFNFMENQLAEMDRQFAHLERNMNEAFRDWGLPIPRIKSVFETNSSAPSMCSRLFPAIETERSPGAEPGKPGKYAIKINLGEGFAPEDIKVSLKDRMLTLHATFEQKSEDGSSRIYQEVSKSFALPDSVNPEEVKSLFTPDGVLTIEAPLPEAEAPKPKEIPISIETK